VRGVTAGMNGESIFKISIGFAYIGIVFLYIRKLKELNAYLLLNYSNQSSFSLLQYNGGQPAKYFVYAVVFIIIGLFLMYFNFRWIGTCTSEPLVVFLFFLIIFIVFVLEIDIVKHINVPIFQAILSAIICGGIVGGVLSSK
jgi:hypothetical protein